MTDTATTIPFSPVPSVERMTATSVTPAASTPSSATAIGIPVGTQGEPPSEVGIPSARTRLSRLRWFRRRKSGRPDRRRGDGVRGRRFGDVERARCRRAPQRSPPWPRRRFTSTARLPPGRYRRRVRRCRRPGDPEGVLLARYRYDPCGGSRRGPPSSPSPWSAAAEADAATGWPRPGVRGATPLARDLANSPHSHLNAPAWPTSATRARPPTGGSTVEVFDKDAAASSSAAAGCSASTRAASSRPHDQAHLPPAGRAGPATSRWSARASCTTRAGSPQAGDEVHAQMKNDMSGAAAVLAAMSALPRRSTARRRSPRG